MSELIVTELENLKHVEYSLSSVKIVILTGNLYWLLKDLIRTLNYNFQTRIDTPEAKPLIHQASHPT